MPSNLTELEFSLDDVVGQEPLSPETVDLPTLRGFLQEVETLIKGDVPGATLSDSRVRIKEGSLKVVALVAPLLATDFIGDMEKLEAKGDLDAIQPKRAQVIEQWQSRTRRTPSRTYLVLSRTATPLRIVAQSQFQHSGENAWVAVEKYLSGKVVDAGGKQDPNVHIVLADSGESVRVNATEEQLGAEKENLLYKHVNVRVQAQQHLQSKALRDIRLIQFLPRVNEVDEEALQALWQKGRKAWKDVKSAAGWVETLRGNT